MEIVRLRQSDGQLDRCPKCLAQVAPGQSECFECGVLIPKFLAQIEDPLQADFRKEFGPEFTDQWQNVVEDYENLETHWNFILACQQLNALEFAAYRYRRLVEVVNDDIARMMLTRIEALMLVELEDEKLNRAPSQRDELFWLPAWFTLPVYFLSAIAMFLGFAGSQFTAASIIGTILLISLLALRLLFRYYAELSYPKV